MYDWVEIPRGKYKVLIGDGKAMRVLGVGSLNLKMHSKTDLKVKLNAAYVTEGIGFNLFSFHDAQAKQPITLGKNGAHLFDNRLTFPRDATGSSLFATRMDPTPTTGLPAKNNTRYYGSWLIICELVTTPDFRVEEASSILEEMVSFFSFTFLYYVRKPDTTDANQHMSSAGGGYNKLSTTLYTPASRQQSRKQHHACAVVCVRCIAVASYQQ